MSDGSSHARENEEEMSVPVGVSRMGTLVASTSVPWTAHVSAGCSSEDAEVGIYLNVQFRKEVRLRTAM